MKILSIITNSLFVFLLLCVAALFMTPLLPIERNIDLKIVQSGSMEPAIKTGSVVVLKPASHYEVGDVIAFTSTASRIPTTHRIVGVEEKSGERMFTTKGDANEEADNQLVPQRDVLGKVLFSMPYAGFILDFARQPLGFALLIVLPALMLILGELEKIWHEVKKKKAGKKNDEALKERVVSLRTQDTFEVKEVVRMIEINRPIIQEEKTLQLRHLTVMSINDYGSTRKAFTETVAGILVVVSAASLYGLGFVGSTVSYFNDTEASLGNMLTASTLDLTLMPDGSLYTFVGTDLAGGPVVIEAPVPTASSAEALHEMHVEITAGSIPFCEAILADAGAPVSFTGPLLNLSATEVTFADPWELALTLSSPFTNGEMCGVDIVYTSWHFAGTFGEGYHDEERVSLMFQAPIVVAPVQQFLQSVITKSEEDPDLLELEPVAKEEEIVEGEGEVPEEGIEEEVIESVEETEEADAKEEELESVDAVEVQEEEPPTEDVREV